MRSEGHAMLWRAGCCSEAGRVSSRAVADQGGAHSGRSTRLLLSSRVHAAQARASVASV